ncbi:MAG: MbnP family protein [Bacteroidia bacterium]|nr:MbnP family protein [Bacteroidia bacterium]
MQRTASALLPLLLLLAACKPDPEQQAEIRLQFTPLVGRDDFAPGTVYASPGGRAYTVETFRLYVSDVELVREGSGKTERLADVVLYDFGIQTFYTPDSSGSGPLTAYVKPNTYSAVRFKIGVPPELNGGNPAQYPSLHPLSVSRGNHWNWTTGYVFFKLEGRVDSTSTQTGPPALGFTYHTGTDALLRTVEIPLGGVRFSLAERGGVYDLPVYLDLNQIFANPQDTIDLAERNLTHTMPPGSPDYILAEELTNNLAQRAFR